MFHSMSLLAPGGIVPRCFGFRLRPRLLAGQPAGNGPWPVKLRYTGTEHHPDLLVYDSGLKCKIRVAADGEPPLGPYIIDPEGSEPAYAWDVEWFDEEGEMAYPVLDGTDGGLGGALAIASRAVVVYDSGMVAGGALIASPVLDTSRFESLLVNANNSAGALDRAVSLLWLLDDGVTGIYTAPMTSVAGSNRMFTVGHAAAGSNVAGAVSALVPARFQVNMGAAGVGAATAAAPANQTAGRAGAWHASALPDRAARILRPCV